MCLEINHLLMVISCNQTTRVDLEGEVHVSTKTCCNYSISNAPCGVLHYPPRGHPAIGEPWNVLMAMGDSYSEETRDMDKG